MSGTIGLPVLVLDVAGATGAGIVAALVEAGHAVLAASPDQSPLHALRRRHAYAAGLRCLKGGTSSEASARRLAAQVRRHAPAGVQAIVSGWSPSAATARLTERPVTALMDALQSGLASPLHQARHLWPLLHEHSGQHLLVGGLAADCTWCGYGHLAIASAARRMLVRMLHEEAGPRGIRVRMLAFARPPAGSAAPRPDALGRDVAAMLADAAALPGAVAIHRAAGTVCANSAVAAAVAAWLAGLAVPPPSSDSRSSLSSRTRTFPR